MATVRVRDVVTAFLSRHHDGETRVFIVRRSGQVGTYRGRWSAISGYLEADGESLGHSPLTFEILPACLKVITG